MKKISTILVLCLVALTTIVGCKVEDSDYNVAKPMERACNIFAHWQYAYANTQMRFANVAFNFNAWLTADTDTRDSIQKLYFNGMTIRDNGDGSWTLLSANKEKCTINTHNRTLDVFGAKWEVTERERVGNYVPNLFVNHWFPIKMEDFSTKTAVVSFVEVGKWSVNINAEQFEETTIGGPTPYLSVELSTPDHTVIRDLRDGGYTITGSGKFSFVGYPYEDASSDIVPSSSLFFNIDEPLYCDGRDVWNGGKLKIEVSRQLENGTMQMECVGAEFLPQNNPYLVRLNYNGNVADWRYDDGSALIVRNK